MKKNTNYYDILLKLSKLKEKLRHFILDRNPKSLSKYEILLLENNALIHEYDILRDEYQKKLDEFLSYTKKEGYQKNVDDTLKRVTNFVIDSLSERKIDIKYSNELDEDINQVVHTARVHYDAYIEIDSAGNFIGGPGTKEDKSKKSVYRIYYDIPNLYLYSSVKAISLRKYYDDGIKYDNVYTRNSIKEFYNSVGDLNIFGNQITDIINLPDNLAYYVSSFIINTNFVVFDNNVGYFIMSALVEVLTDLEEFIRNKINQELANNADTDTQDIEGKKHKKFAPQQQKIYKLIIEKVNNHNADYIIRDQLLKCIDTKSVKCLNSALTRFRSKCREIYNIEDEDFEILKYDEKFDRYKIQKEWLKLITENNQQKS